MPRGDGTGPTGAGAKTGRAAGYCAGYDRPGFANPATGAARRPFFGRAAGAVGGIFGRPRLGLGRGFRGGRGRGGRGRW